MLRRRSERDLVRLLSLRLLSFSLLSPRTQENPSSLSPLYRLTPRSHPFGHVSSLDSKPYRLATATETFIGPFSFFSTRISSFSPSFSQLLKEKGELSSSIVPGGDGWQQGGEARLAGDEKATATAALRSDSVVSHGGRISSLLSLSLS